MRVDGNGSEHPNYYPNSFDEMEIDQNTKSRHYH
jgi:catalase